jgi:hypothetical protein
VGEDPVERRMRQRVKEQRTLEEEDQVEEHNQLEELRKQEHQGVGRNLKCYYG